MSDIRDADEVWVSTSKNGDYVSAEEVEDSVRFVRSALSPTQSDKDKEIERLREALIEIERVYYNEGENVKRRAARMRALASEALEERG